MPLPCYDRLPPSLILAPEHGRFSWGLPPDSPLLCREGDKFLGEPIWLQGAEYRSSADGAPMIAFLHLFYDGAPDLDPVEESRSGAGIIWLPKTWVRSRPYESQIDMTWDMD